MVSGYHFVTNCVSCPGPDAGTDINAMIDTATQITRRTFLKYVDHAELQRVEYGLGYEVRYTRRGLTMSRDWHVAYFKSTFRGRPCVYFVWSAIEYIFCPAEAS